VSPIDFREYSVDVIEVNQVVKVDEFGRIREATLLQVIFWDWNGRRGEFLVRDWKKWTPKHRPPEYDHKRKRWRLIFEENEKWITVYATSYIQTVTDFDPEILNRKLLTPDGRRRIH